MSKGFVFRSKFTPGLENAMDVKLDVGDKVTYQLLGGGTVTGVVKSTYSQHTNGCYGYEVLFDDTKQLGFADEARIVNWPGKGAWKAS